MPRVKDADGLSITVLVVDDDALIAMSTVGMLEDLGHEAVRCRVPRPAPWKFSKVANTSTF